MKKILAICGSTRAQSANLKLLRVIAKMTKEAFDFEIFEGLSGIPHFNPDLDGESPPTAVADFRKRISEADAVLVCTPEYVYSIPGSLKNALEWTVSTTVFSDKPAGLITASAGGKKGHTELKMIMKILGTKFGPKTCLLISSIKVKMGDDGNIRNEKTKLEVDEFVASFQKLIAKHEAGRLKAV